VIFINGWLEDDDQMIHFPFGAYFGLVSGAIYVTVSFSACIFTKKPLEKWNFRLTNLQPPGDGSQRPCPDTLRFVGPVTRRIGGLVGLSHGNQKVKCETSILGRLKMTTP